MENVDRQFRRAGPNEFWVTDISEHPTGEGMIYYCVVLDAFGVPDAGGTRDPSHLPPISRETTNEVRPP